MSPIRTDEACQASPDLLAESIGHRQATTRTPGHHVGGNEELNVREIHPGLLSTYDHRRVATLTIGGRSCSGLHHPV